MSVRKRVWKTSKGEEKTAWLVDYVDARGKRRRKTFTRKKQADDFEATARVEVRDGVHVADRDTVTIKKAGEFWIASGEAAGLERSTINQRKRHLKFHIVPLIGDTLLSKVSVPFVRAFEDTLRDGRSPAMVKKVVGSLGSILSDATERGLAARNPVRDMRGTRKGKERRAEKRQKGKLEVGVDIPTRDEIKALVDALEGRWRPLIMTAIFTGIRSSELRGLRWNDFDYLAATIRVHQRADEFGEIGPPKSDAGKRTIPLPKILATTLRELRLKSWRNGKENTLVFANGQGNPESHANIINRGLVPAMVRAGITIDTGKKDEEGAPILKAKYSGLHALRHFYASWLINPKDRGGLGLPLKIVQERMGHSSITMTADTYGHLFPRGDDGAELAEAANALLA
jgi:integrase